MANEVNRQLVKMTYILTKLKILVEYKMCNIIMMSYTCQNEHIQLVSLTRKKHILGLYVNSWSLAYLHTLMLPINIVIVGVQL